MQAHTIHIYTKQYTPYFLGNLFGIRTRYMKGLFYLVLLDTHKSIFSQEKKIVGTILNRS